MSLNRVPKVNQGMERPLLTLALSVSVLAFSSCPVERAPKPKPTSVATNTPSSVPVPQLIDKPWQTPKPGWLHVLDPANSGSESRVILVEPQTGEVRGTIKAGHDPAIAMSRSGDRLFVSSLENDEMLLGVYSSQSGERVAEFELKNRRRGTTLPAFSAIVAAPDESLYYLRRQITGPGRAENELIRLNLITGMESVVGLDDCGVGIIVAIRESQVAVACPSQNVVWFVEVTNDRLEKPARARLPTRPKLTTENGNDLVAPIVAAHTTRASDSIWVIYLDGHVSILDSDSRREIRSADLQVSKERRLVSHSAVAVSPDRRNLFVGVMKMDDIGSGEIRDISFYETSTWKHLRSIDSPTPIWSLSVSRDSRNIYAVSPWEGALLTFDARKGTFKRKFSGIGKSPAYLIEQAS